MQLWDAVHDRYKGGGGFATSRKVWEGGKETRTDILHSLGREALIRGRRRRMRRERTKLIREQLKVSLLTNEHKSLSALIYIRDDKAAVKKRYEL
jgi:hypothetical protein